MSALSKLTHGACVCMLAGLLVFISLIQRVELASFSVTNSPNFSPTMQVAMKLDVTVDGAVTRPLELKMGQQPMDAAEEFCRTYGLMEYEEADRDPNVLRLAAELQRRLAAGVGEADEDDLVAVDVQVDGAPALLRHSPGRDPAEEAAEFCRFTGLSGDPAAACAAQLGAALRARVEASRAAAAAAAGAGGADAAAAARGAPLVSVPVTIRDRQSTLELHLGESPLEAAYAFLARQGLGGSPDFQGYLTALTGELEARLDAVRRQREEEDEGAGGGGGGGRRQYSVPLEVDGRNVDLVFRSGEDPGAVARAFCARPEVGLATPGQMQSCTAQAEAMVRALLEEGGAPAAPAAAAGAGAAGAAAARAAAAPLLTLPLDVGAARFTVAVAEGDTARAAATRFCVENFEPLQAAMREAGVGTGLPMNTCLEYTQSLVAEAVAARGAEGAEGAGAPAAAAPAAAAATAGAAGGGGGEAAAAAAEGGEVLFELGVRLRADAPAARVAFRRGDDPAAVARRFLYDQEMNQEYAEQLAAALAQRAAELAAAAAAAAAADGPAAAAAAAPPLFNLPVALREGGAPVALPYREGEDPRAVARAFALRHGVSADFVPVLTQEIQRRLAAVRAAAAAAAAAAAPPAAPAARAPLFAFDVLVAEGRPPVTLRFYEGDRPAEAARAFVAEHGLPAQYEETVASAIVGRVRALLPAAEEEGDKGEWMFSFGVRETATGPESTFNFYQNDTPEAAVDRFLRATGLSGALRADLLRAAAQLLAERGGGGDGGGGGGAAAAAAAPAEPAAAARSPLLSLPIRRAPQDAPVMLNVYRGDSPVVVAEAFLREYAVDFSAKDQLVNYIQERLAAMLSEEEGGLGAAAEAEVAPAGGDVGMGVPGEVLFTIGVKLGEDADPAPLAVRVGDQPRALAERFLRSHGLSLDFADAIVSTIEARVRQLQQQALLAQEA